MKQNKAFTLVELIVVITILAVLATVAFISMQGYAKDSRNAVRQSDMKIIHNALEYNFLEENKYPQPSDIANITLNGSAIIYQGKLDKSIQEKISVFGESKDPLTNEFYTYTTNPSKSKYSLFTEIEGAGASILETTFAQTKKIVGKGKGAGAIIDSSGSFVETDLALDTINDSEYGFVLENTQIKNATQQEIITISTLDNKNLANLDTSLKSYWDMETLTNDGKLKDFGTNQFHLNLNGGIKVGNSKGIEGKATQFDGVDDYLHILDSSSFEPRFYTISVLLQPNLIQDHSYIFQKGCPSTSCNYSGFSMTTRFSTKLRNFFFVKDGETERLNEIVSDFDIDETYKLFTSTYDGNSLKTYIDGTLVEENSVSGEIHYQDDYLIVGRACVDGLCTGGLLKGEIDELKVYDRALSSDEVKSIYNKYIQK